MTGNVEKKVHVSWAGSPKRSEMYQMNKRILSELEKKYKIETIYIKEKYKIEKIDPNVFSDIDLSAYDVVLARHREVDYPPSVAARYLRGEELTEYEQGYGETTDRWQVVKNAPCLSPDELALICDGGNLCFGYFMRNDMIKIFTD